MLRIKNNQKDITIYVAIHVAIQLAGNSFPASSLPTWDRHCLGLCQLHQNVPSHCISPSQQLTSFAQSGDPQVQSEGSIDPSIHPRHFLALHGTSRIL